MDQFIGKHDRNRWLSYFDFLGVQALIAGGREGTVFNAYWAAMREFKNHDKWAPTLGHAWLSDTFLIVGDDDSPECFARVEKMSRCFAGSLIGRGIPLRGSIACDRFYADFEDRTFFGRALVEAYQIGECQDWIGLVLCPSAERRLHEMPSGASINSYWRKVAIPWKKGLANPDSLFACLLGSWGHVNGQNPLIEVLRTMRAGSVDERIAKKYERTIAFLESQNPRNG